jgi:hypothetical protein
MVAAVKMAVFWNFALCSLIEIGQRFRGAAASIIRALITLMIAPLKCHSISMRLRGATSQ